jgi:hypothetical protein
MLRYTQHDNPKTFLSVSFSSSIVILSEAKNLVPPLTLIHLAILHSNLAIQD